MRGTLWGGDVPVNDLVAAYTVGDDRRLDARLLAWDILGTMAHARGLRHAGILDDAEHLRLHAALREALEAASGGELRIGPEDEDVHSALERHLVGRLGDLGRKVHTGRSRNDQVAVDLRLHLKDRLLETMAATVAAARALLRLARRHRATLWPGYTHMRRAMPSTVALWAAGFAEALVEDLVPQWAALDLVDRSPLGSAAGYGTPLPLPREEVARWLGFAGPQRVVTAAQLARGKLEAVVLQSLWPVARDLGVLASDVVLFSTEEFGFLRIPEALATGSSIMPHKRNPDLFELTRARAAALDGLVVQAMAVAGKLPGGYHRDFQLTKGPVLDGVERALEMLRTMAWAVPQLEVDVERCRDAVTGEVLAADEALRRAREGTPFRTAYREVAGELREGRTPPRLPAGTILAARARPGEAGDPVPAPLTAALRRWSRRISDRRRAFDAAMQRLIRGTVEV